MMPCSASSNVYTGAINSIQCDLNWPSKLCKPQFPLNALRINGQKILCGNDLESFFLPVLVQLLILHCVTCYWSVLCVYRIICTMTVTPCSLKSMATPPSSTVSSRQSRDKQPSVAEESHQQYSKLNAIHYKG